MRVVLLLAGAAAVWSTHAIVDALAAWRFSAYVASREATGRPTTPRGLQPVPVAPTEDAAPALRSAWRLIDGDALREDGVEPGWLTLPEGEEAARLRRMVTAHREALAALEVETLPPARDWREVGAAWEEVEVRRPYSLTLLPHLMPLQQVSRLVVADAAVQAIDGQWTQAMDRLHLALGVGQSVDPEAGLIAYFVAAASQLAVAQMAMRVSIELADAPADAVDPAAVRALIESLLDEAATDARWHRAMDGERVRLLDTARVVFRRGGRWLAAVQSIGILALPPERGQRPFAALDDVAAPRTGSEALAMDLGGWLLRPLWRLNAVEAARIIDVAQAAGTAPALPAYLARLPRVSQAHPLRDLFTTGFLPSLERAGISHYRAKAERRMAATALAVALYRRDHAGQLPPTLEALVPAYLPAVPRDPMAEDAPLGYSPLRGILWSVGEDGVDHGGSAQPRRERQRPQPYDRWMSLDAVTPLTRPAAEGLRRWPPPQPEPGVHQAI